MYTTEQVFVEFEGYTIDAEVTLDDGVAIDVAEVYLETDSTSRVPIHPSDLHALALRKLFAAAEKAHDTFMEAAE